MPATTGERTRLSFPDCLVMVCAFGSAFLVPSLPGNLAIVDAPLFLVALIGLPLLLTTPSAFRTLLERSAAWLWLIVVGGLLAMFGPGLARWAVDGAVRDLVAPLVFFAYGAILVRSRRRPQLALMAFVAAGVVVAVAVLGHDTGLRAVGTFGNPNYAGHFLATAIILLAASRRRSLGTGAVQVLMGAAVLRTGSFGAILMLLAAATYAAWRATRAAPALHSRMLSGLIVCLIPAILFLGYNQATTQPEADYGSGISASRLERSSDARLDLWRTGLSAIPGHPLGLAPGGVHHRNLTARPGGFRPELHSDPVSFLVENGVVGLIGIVGLVAALWRATDKRRGPGRVLLAAFVAASFFRETFNFRHLWLALAIAVALEWSDRPSSEVATRHVAEATA